MKPTARNAFERSWSASRGRPSSLVSMLTPMQAMIGQAANHWQLTLAPMRALDALPVWYALGDAADACTLLTDCSSANGKPARPLDGFKYLERLAVDVGEALDEKHLVLNDAQLREVLELLECDHLSLVRLTGMVDVRDAAAIDAAVAKGDSALDADLRAIASMDVRRDSVIELHVRDEEHAYRLVAENFRQYLAALLNRSAGAIEPPQPWQIERLMSETSELTVRPIESEVFSTFVDIGISTLPNGTPGPAARSLIYDLPSGTWHDEE
jgi:hypothetical protein